MSEIADMMLDGTLCEGCGVLISTVPTGYPVRCPACAPPPSASSEPSTSRAKVQCPTCARWVKRTGLSDHLAQMHGITELPADADKLPNKKTPCPECGKLVMSHGLPDHLRVAHAKLDRAKVLELAKDTFGPCHTYDEDLLVLFALGVWGMKPT